PYISSPSLHYTLPIYHPQPLLSLIHVLRPTSTLTLVRITITCRDESLQGIIRIILLGGACRCLLLSSDLGSFCLIAQMIFFVVQDRKSTRLNSSHVKI